MSGSIYARPSAPRIILRPAAVTVALHAVLLWALTFSWGGNEPKVIEAKVLPKAINARLVDASEFRPKPKPKAAPAPRPQPKPAPKPQPKAAPKPQPKAAPKPQPKPVPAPARPEPRPEPRLTEQELRELARSDLARAMAEEDQALSAASAEELAVSYAALIQQTVINYWSRPPSARNGMETLLQLQLIPTGEVVSVNVLKSSGNAAFDRSAINAVEKAGAFPELKNLPPREFERTFRRFRLLFRPEDLRY